MLAESRVLFLAFLNICLFRKKPQDIPASTGLLAYALGAYALTAVLLLSVTETPVRAFFSAILEVSILGGFIYVLLTLTRKKSRYLQTLTSLYGIGAVLSLIALPVYILLSMYPENQMGQDPIHGFSVLMLACLAIWNLVIMSYVLRHALEAGIFTSFMLAISYMWLMLSISSTFFSSGNV
ncbi:MAG: hypothetical protein AAF410_03665 [Pseudomonadota bacterium]